MPPFQNDPVISKDDGTAIWGESKTWMGVFGKSESTTGGHGVLGEALGTGVAGVSETWHGIYGRSKSTTGGTGVLGESKGTGVAGVSETWIGVYGETKGGAAGVLGEGKQSGDGVKGHASGAGKAAVAGFHLTNSGPGVFGKGNPAGMFDGKVVVHGDIEVTGDLILAGADYAEALTATDPDVPAGTVVVVGEDGDVRPCTHEYDPAVAGIVSGAGGVKPAIVLDRQDRSVTVALVGKVWCLADAAHAPIQPGNLLTTSATAGHARSVTEPSRALGTIIGKALTPLLSGRGLVRVLVSPR
ncbi:hypothetical protein ACWESM_07800 [Nocardia sp. NPDC003999]